MNGDGKPVVALVSLPGSGNTWVRGLLQKATGVCTGSIYCDRTLRAEGFCGEGLRSSALLSIKTHDTALQWKGVKYKNVNPNRPFFDAAIFIIRDPFRAAISEWNRKTSGQFSMNQNGSNHVKYVDTPKLFGESLSLHTHTLTDTHTHTPTHMQETTQYGTIMPDTMPVNGE